MRRLLMSVVALSMLGAMLGNAPPMESREAPPRPLPPHLAQLQQASDEARRRADEKRARKNARRARALRNDR